MFLFFPVVPHILDIVVVFHDVQQLLHSKPSVSGDIEGERGENPTSKVLRYPPIINKQRSVVLVGLFQKDVPHQKRFVFLSFFLASCFLGF